MAKELPRTEAGFYYTGVSGDHSTDGWLEWGLNAHYAEKRAEEDYTPASNRLAMVESYRGTAEAYPEDRAKALKRAEKLMGEAILLAAAEARVRYGVQIIGHESAKAEQEFRDFYDRQAQGYAAALAAKEARAQGVEIVGDFSRPGVIAG